MTSPRAVSRSRSPSAASPAGSARRSSLPTSASRLFGEAPGRAFVVSGPEEALLAAGLPRLQMIGRVGGDQLEISAGGWS